MNDILSELRDADARGVAPPQNWTTRAADEIERLSIGYRRYETARRLNPRAWSEAWNENITTGKPFDEIIDELRPFMESLREHMDLLKQTSISAEYFRLLAERKERIAAEQTDYAISLQRAIEAHCRDEVADTTECPHNAEALNACLARHNTS